FGAFACECVERERERATGFFCVRLLSLGLLCSPVRELCVMPRAS
uniref:Uncharacterized protein n=1 Tax=Anopheles quadriannulatus TaxID=34691 RepID=A0A182XR55_ANOQN